MRQLEGKRDAATGQLKLTKEFLHPSALERARAVGSQEAITAARQNLAYNAHLSGDVEGGFAQLADWQGPFDFSHYSVRAMLEADAITMRVHERGVGETLSSGTGASGAAMQQQLLEAAGEMALLGPYCYGLLDYLHSWALWPVAYGG